MEITEVRIKLMEDSEDRLRAFCSITFDDCFVVRDLKIIDGYSGPFVAMPSRKLSDHCNRCNSKNHLRARFCNQCGARLEHSSLDVDQQGRAKLYADIAHPINAECREAIQRRVIEELEFELSRSDDPNYRSRYDDAYPMDAGPEVDMEDHPIPEQSGKIERTDQAHSELSGPHKDEKPETQKQEVERQPRLRKEEDFGKGIFD